MFSLCDTKTSRKLALKQGGSFGYSASEFCHAVYERLAHNQMNDANIIARLHHAFQTRGKLYLATEFFDGGNVYSLFGMRGGGVTEEQARLITAQVPLDLKSLHNECIVFSDLKPENVLLDREDRVRLANFGLRVMLNSANTYNTNSMWDVFVCSGRNFRGNWLRSIVRSLNVGNILVPHHEWTASPCCGITARST